MWPYTNDESSWLAAALETSDGRAPDPHSLFALELAARRYRAQVIAGLLSNAARGLWRLLRGTPQRGKPRPDGLLVRLG